ncbi:MAG: DUF6065 family protein [Phycisphaerales bacterium]
MSEQATRPVQISGPLRLTAYKTSQNPGYLLEPAPVRRDWMDAFPNRWPYRCLPMSMANQAGWVIRTPIPITLRWNGKHEQKGVTVAMPADAPELMKRSVVPFFGGGIITFNFPWLFRTDPGVGLWVRGPVNSPTDSIMALEGIVETDWNVNNFTMNWKIMRRNAEIYFQAGDPVCLLTPIALDLLESVAPEIRDIRDEPGLAQQVGEANRTRTEAIQANIELARQAAESGQEKVETPVWERKYVAGTLPDGSRVHEHRTNFKLAPFDRKTRGAKGNA